MRLQFHAIDPALKPYVKVICSMDCDEEADTTHIRVLPDACVELFISYTATPVAIIGNELHKQSIVTFRMSKPMDVQMRKGSGCMAICFYPGTAHSFFSLPMQAVSDTTTGLHDLWKQQASMIEDQIANCADNHKRAVIVQNYLLTQLAGSKYDNHLNQCLQMIQHCGNSITVNDLVERTGISQRHLSRKFQQSVGLSPQAYIRVNRFIQSLQNLKKKQHASLTEIAYQSGYFDQAHFNHDYKEYSGHTPSEVFHSAHILY